MMGGKSMRCGICDRILRSLTKMSDAFVFSEKFIRAPRNKNGTETSEEWIGPINSSTYSYFHARCGDHSARSLVTETFVSPVPDAPGF